MNNKKDVRAFLNDLRKSHDSLWLAEQSEKISGYLLSWDKFKNASIIFAYLSFGNEVSIDKVIKEALRLNKTVLVPYIDENKKGIMHVVQLKSFDEITVGKFDIRTIENKSIFTDVDKIDLILNPGLGFDRNGGRIGLGAGFYDRFLKQCSNALKTGVTLSSHLLEKIPLDEHDVLMNYLVDEKGILKCEQNI